MGTKLRALRGTFYDRMTADVTLGGGLTAIVGRNSSGKTTLLNAISMALDTPAAGSPVFEVHAEWADGTRVDRTVRHKDDKTMHHSVVVEAGDFRVDRPKEATAAIGTRLGRARVFNVGEFLGKTPRERQKVIEGSLVLAGGLEEVKAAFVEVKLSADARAAVREKYKLAEQKPTGQEYLAAWLAALNAAKNAAKAAVDSANKVVERLIQPDAKMLPSGTLADWKSRQDDVNAQIAKLSGDLRFLDGQEKAAAAAAAAIDALAREYAATAALASGEGVARVTALRDEALEQYAGALKLSEDKRAAWAEAEAAANAASANFAALQERIGSVSERLQAIDAVSASPLVAELLAAAAALADHVGYLSEPDDIAAIERVRDAVHACGAGDRAAAVALRVDLAAAKSEYNAATAQHAALTRRAASLRSTWEASIPSDPSAHYAIALRSEEMRRAEAKQQLPAVAARLDIARAGAQAVDVDRRTELGRQISVLTEERRAIAGHIEQYARYETAGVEYARQVRDRDASFALFDELRAAELVALRIAGQLYAGWLEPLTGPASILTRRTLGKELTLRPDHGWSVYVGDQPITECSESEAMIASAALSAAVQSRQQGGWRVVLLDGLEALDHTRRAAFLEGARAMIRARVVDDVVVTWVEDGFAAPSPEKGWRVIQTGDAMRPLGGRS